MAIIQIKYSTANTAPADGSLVGGELAYSFLSNKLFIGNEGTGAANVIGGEYYTTIINANTPLANANTIVTRNQFGSFAANVITANTFVGTFSGDISGNAGTASQLQNTFTIFLTGDASGNISVNGSSNVNLSVSLSDTNVTSGSYGNTRYIPTFTVGSDGRITSVSNVAVDFPGTADFAQNSYDHANAAYLHANSGHSVANTANNTATAASSYANSAYTLANLVNSIASFASLQANAAFQAANTGIDTWVRDAANSASRYANSAYIHANASYEIANIANVSYAHANAAFITANTSLNNSINTSLLLTNIFANTVSVINDVQRVSDHANASFSRTNTVYNVANTKFSSSGGTVSGDVVVTGNLTVSGVTTYVATNQLNIGDNVLVLNSDLGQSASPTENAGIEVERGIYQNASILWNETTKTWQFTGNSSTSNIASAAAESYANSAFNEANSAYAIAGQTNILALGTAIAANAAGSYANSAYARANAAFTGASGSHSASAYAHANSAYNAANAAGLQFAVSAYEHANAAFDVANNALIAGGTIAGNYANSAFSKANAAFDRANTANDSATLAFNYANSSYSETNTATAIALAAFALANSIQLTEGGILANLAYEQANSAYDQSNTNTITIGSAYTQANAAFGAANSAGAYANAAFATANTKLNSAGGTITGDLTVSGNLRVDGDRAILSVSSITIDDNLIDISAGTVGNPTSNSGIRVVRGDETGVQIRWNEVNDYWQFTNDGVNYNNIASAAAESYANSAYFKANLAGSYANSGYSLANTVEILAQAAFDTANNAGTSDYTQAAFDKANTVGLHANSSYTHANAAFNQANTATSSAASALSSIVVVDQKAVSAGVYANAAFTIANVSNDKAAAAFRHANASFDVANTKYSSSGGDINGDVRVYGNMTVVGGVTYANTTTLIIADNILTLNAAISQATLPNFNAGIEVDRGISDNVAFLWDEGRDSWTFSNDGINYFNVASSSAESYANGAFAEANAASSHAESAFNKANTNANTIQTVFDTVNTDLLLITAAYEQANAAYDLANGKSTFYFSSTPPLNANEGDRWIDSDLGQEFIYVDDGDSLQWIELSAFVDQNLVDDNTYYRLETARTGNDSDTVQSIYGVSVNLLANTVYEFEASFSLEKTSGSNSHALALGFAGSATVNNILYKVIHNNSALNSPATPTSIMINTVSSTTVSSASDVDNHNVFLKGTISVGSAGSFTPQYRLTSTPGGAFDTLAGSYFKLEPVGSSNTNINIGSWY
jgi:hypothetical protein